MEEVPLSPSKLNSNLKSPTLRVRSPSAKSNIAISRGDDDSSIDDDRINNKMCVSDGSTITCVFNKKRLFGGSAFALVAVVVIMAVAIATRSDGGSSSSSANHMNKVATVGGGNSNAAVGTAEVGSAAPPKVAPVAPKVTPVAPAKSNFAFVAPNSGIGGGSAVERCPGVSGSGKSGKSGSFCYSSGKSGKSGGHGFINIEGSSWYGSGKSGKSGSFPLPTCDVKSSGKSGKSGYNSFLDAYRVGSDSWYSSGKSGKSGAGYCTLSPENYQDKESTCVTEGDLELNAGCWFDPTTPNQANLERVETIKLDQPICGGLSRWGDASQDIDVYRFDVICPGPHTLIIRSTGVNPTGGGLFDVDGVPIIEPRLFGSNAQCQALTGGSVFTDPINVRPVADGGILTSLFLDLQNEIFAVTVDVPRSACGAIYIELAADNLDRTLLPTCDDGDYNCGDLGGFLYSVELTEGTVKCGAVDTDGNFVDDSCILE